MHASVASVLKINTGGNEYQDVCCYLQGSFGMSPVFSGVWRPVGELLDVRRKDHLSAET